MAKDLLMFRVGRSLIPADDLAEEDMMELPEAKRIMVKAAQTRSLPQHRLLFGLIRKAARACPTPVTENALRQWLTVRTGHVDYLPLGFGETYTAPRSWKFDEMDQTEFRKLFDDVVHLILTEVAPSLPRSVIDEIIAILDGQGAREGQPSARAA